MEVQVILTGPEGSGKSTFVQQLKSIYETRSIVWPAASLIKISPTTGKEIFSFSLENGRTVNRPVAKEWVRSEVGLSRHGERLLRRWENTCVREYDPVLPPLYTAGIPYPRDETDPCSCKLTEVIGTLERPPVPKALFYPPVTPSITMTAVTSLQRNNNTDTTHRAGQSGNTNTFSVVDHTMDSSAFITRPPQGAGELVGFADVSKTKSEGEQNVTRKDYRQRQMKEVEKMRMEKAETTDKQVSAGSRDGEEDYIRKIFPDDDDSFRQFTVEVHEIGGRMLSVLPKFMTRVNLSGTNREDLQPNGPDGLFVFMIDLTNPSQIPSAAIELSYIRQTYLKQTKTSRRRWCVVANKCMTLLSSGAPPISHGRVAGGSVLSAGGIDAAEIALVRHRVRQLLMLSDHAENTSEDDTTEEDDGDDDENNVCDHNSRHVLKRPIFVTSADGRMKRPAVREDLTPPIFIVDTWTGTGMGDFMAWFEDR